MEEVPVFRPSEAEFADFVSYVTMLEQTVHTGVCKVVPPSSWRARTSYDDIDFPIAAPIKQLPSGKAGLFRVNLIESPATTYQEFRETAHRYHAKTLPPAKAKDVASREEHYWKGFRFHSPTYGADQAGSLFDTDVTTWNIKTLPDLLHVLGHVPGVTDPYLYAGMFGASFTWHIEDMDLFSINFLHTGAPKSWYCTRRAEAGRFERFAESCFPDDAAECKEFLRHKTLQISPTALRKAGLHVGHMVQNAGEFMITFPRGYHSGFNHGLNVAESRNFALEAWFPYGFQASPCLCREDTVRIDVQHMEETLLGLGKLSEEYVEKKRARAAIEGTPDHTTRRSSKGKRTADEDSSPRPRKASKVEQPDQVNLLATRPPGGTCALCRRGEETPISGAFLPFAFQSGARTCWVHRNCALYSPEVCAGDNDDGELVSYGVASAVRRAASLRCAQCDGRGASIGCTLPVCVKSFHLACTGKTLDFFRPRDRSFFCVEHENT